MRRARRSPGSLAAMVGAVLIVLALLVLPIFVTLSGAVAAAGLGFFLKKDAEERHAGSELIDLNR